MEIKLSPVDYIKVNRTRHDRGYAFEHSMVQKLNRVPGWYARRLGGSSAGLPDLIIVNNKTSELYSVEAKSGMDVKKLYIDKLDQIIRCIDIAKMFGVYKQRNVLFSFKFSSPVKSVMPKIYHFLLLSEYWNNLTELRRVFCTIYGECYLEFNDGNTRQLGRFYFPEVTKLNI